MGMNQLIWQTVSMILNLIRNSSWINHKFTAFFISFSPFLFAIFVKAALKEASLNYYFKLSPTPSRCQIYCSQFGGFIFGYTYIWRPNETILEILLLISFCNVSCNIYFSNNTQWWMFFCLSVYYTQTMLISAFLIHRT